MEAFEPKPTYQEQLAWLDMVQLIYSEDPEMIKTIKENVIAVINYEKALEKELQPVQKGEQTVQAYKESMGLNDPFVFQADELNPREESLIHNRIKKLQAELQFELSRKKQFRNQQAIDHCRKSINNLRKWKSQSL